MQLPSRTGTPQIAVLIPCFNEELTVGKVVRDFRTQLPDADIYVFDNDSTDNTIDAAKRAGAIVIEEKRRGKGYVVQSMFRKVEADVYVLVDGDDTYPVESVNELIAPILRDEADMVVGSRLINAASSEFKALNRFGNHLFLMFLNAFFRTQLTDALSGYRVMTREFVKTMPILSTGFAIEIELTVKALERGYRTIEIPIALRRRPEGSSSKIKILRDGIVILTTIFLLFRDYKPMAFFSLVGALLIAGGLIPGTIVIDEFLRTRLVLHMPSAVLAVGLELAGMLCFLVGLVLDAISRRFREIDYGLRTLHRT